MGSESIFVPVNAPPPSRHPAGSKPSCDEKNSHWRVETLKDGRPVTLRPKHLVVTTGMSGFPHCPEIPGAAAFEGTILHSSAFQGGAAWRGKKCVVATTESLLEHAWGRLYSQAALAKGIHTDLADLTVALIPHKVLPSLQQPIYRLIAEQHKDLYAGLARGLHHRDRRLENDRRGCRRRARERNSGRDRGGTATTE